LELGYNYRLTDIQAALGLSQAKRIDSYVARRTQLAHKYDEALADLPVVRPWQDSRASSSWHLYVLQLATGQMKKTQREVFENLRHAGIGVNLHYIPVHLQPFYQQLGSRPGDLPEAEAYYRRAITLPLFPGLRSDELDFVVDHLRSNLLS
jgi:dTDP-4-amino-4,6-dideoxygalactose transaminase